MTGPGTDRRDVKETEEALCGLVVMGGDTTGVLQLVEAPFDQFAQPSE